VSQFVFVTDVSPYRDAAGAASLAGVHHSLPSAVTTAAQIARLHGLSFRHVGHVTDLSVSDLERARLLMLFTIGETDWSGEQRSVIEQRVRQGDLGLVGLHSASDSAYKWPAYGEFIGARFAGHPVTGVLPVLVVDDAHPATRHLPRRWHFNEEFYLFSDLAEDRRDLLALEFGRSHDGTGGQILPLAWCIERGPMRTFYTALGHFGAAYENVEFVRHLGGGVSWVLSQPPQSRGV
jgi:type 1 glutamine amidotransferase